MATVSSNRDKTRATRVSKPKRPTKPSEDRVRILAYELYERRRADCSPGDAASDWIEAERRLSY